MVAHTTKGIAGQSGQSGSSAGCRRYWPPTWLANHYGLAVKTGSFTSGRSLSPFVPAWGIDLFLSNMDADVKGAVAGGAAAARLGLAPKDRAETPTGEVRVAFDGDAVVFDAE